MKNFETKKIKWTIASMTQDEWADGTYNWTGAEETMIVDADAYEPDDYINDNIENLQNCELIKTNAYSDSNGNHVEMAYEITYVDVYDELKTQIISFYGIEMDWTPENDLGLLKSYYRGHNVEIVEIDGEGYVMDMNTWNGETADGWQVDVDTLNYFNECEIKPIFSEPDDDGDCEIIGYRAF